MKIRKNNWYVVTGGPCSGKTTVLLELAERGFTVIPEAARVYIETELKKGRKLADIRKNELAFQQGILKTKIDLEKKLPPQKTVFFDRAIPDSVAYYRKCGLLNDTELTKAVQKSIYKKVFVFELLEYSADYARIESKVEAQLLETWLLEAYRALPAPVVYVPRMSVEERAQFVLNGL